MKKQVMGMLFLAAFAFAADAAIVGQVATGSSGTVVADCADAKGWAFELTSEGYEGRDVVTVRMKSPVEAIPPAFSVLFDLDGTAAQHVWTCNWGQDAYHLWPAAWTDKKFMSQLAFGTPVMVAFDGDEHALVETACSEVFNKVEYSLLVKENVCVLKGNFRFFTEAVTPMREYEVKVLIDTRRKFWAEAVSDATAWICRENGFTAATVPEAARDPLYSTWYAYWQDVHAEPLEREARLAADLGMRTMILDDGWQKVDSVSFYSATGDWMPVPSRFPDMKAHVAKVHEAGLKYMLWLSVPYMGDESKAWARFGKKTLYVHGNKSPGRVGVLDPRFPDVREYLISTYERVIGEWGFDGVKLDFIDSFKLTGNDPAVKDNYAGRDYKSVPAAVDRLMTDILARLRKINPDVLVEFRQSYMGPAILKYGNMIRAADCPADPWSNRRRICDLRLTSGRTAVHSDMIVWNRNETPEGAALPILNALFSTIQYSMILAEAPEAHREVIRHWLGFSQRHRGALLKGEFRPHHPQANYPVIEAEDADERIVAVYNATSFAEVGSAGKDVYVINATRAGRLAVDVPRACAAEAFDTFGKSAGARELSAGLQKVDVPAGGYLMIPGERTVAARAAFGPAKWLWPRGLGMVTNTVVEFRRRFTAAKAVPLELAIAADTVYAVELNGQSVHSGRFPDVPPQRYYDVLPLGEAQPGENELKVSLYVQGIDSFQTLPGDPGLMFALKGEGIRADSGTGTDWRLSTRDRRDGVPRVTSQLGFSFEYDAAKPEADWRPVVAADAVRGTDDFVLEPRPVPRVEILPELPMKIVGQGRLDGSPVPESVSPGMDATRQTAVAADGFFAADGKGVREDLFKDGFYVLTDLGREEAGFLTLDVDTDEGVVIDIGHAEHMENGRIRTHIGYRNFAGRYRAREGRQRYCRWARRMAGRYIQLHVRGVRTHFVLHGVSVRPALFSVTELPPPATLTETQRKIWETSVRTLRLCMHEHYEDCPWREQALYGNDARNQILSGYQAFGKDNRMPELALAVHSRGLDENAWLEMCMPAKIRITIPSFTLCWVMSIGDNLKYRGDAAFTKSMMPTVKRILDARLGEMKDGLLPCPKGTRYWQFYEWAKNLSGARGDRDAVKRAEDRYESPLNLFLVLALESGATCAEATGDTEAALRWRSAAKKLRAEIIRRFWNAEGGHVETSLAVQVAPAELVQSLALLAGAVPEDARASVVRKLMGRSDWTEITLSQTLYKYEALIAAGGEAAKSAIRSMDAEWAKMLEQGATSFWEMREGWSAFEDAGSLCHGWSAVPVYIYGAYPELRR